jgi:hypothetical protein
LDCRLLEEQHARTNFKGLIGFLGFLIVVAIVLLVMDRADATPELEERRFMVHSFWQDGFNPPEGYQAAQDAPGEVVERAGADWGRGVEVWRPLVEAAFPPSEVETAMCVMRGESQGNPDAENPSGASGLFQIMPFWAAHYGLPFEALFNPEANVNLAAALQRDEGWDEWSVWKRGVCS